MYNALLQFTQETPSQIPNETAELLKCYESQQPLYQAIMQIRALTFFTRRKTDFVLCITKSDFSEFGVKKLTPTTLNPLLEDLQRLKLLTANFNCNDKLRQVLTELALDERNPRAQLNLNALAHLPYEPDELVARNINLAAHMNNIEFFQKVVAKDNTTFPELINFMFPVFYDYALSMDWVKSRHPLIQALLCCVKLLPYNSVCKTLPPDMMQWVHHTRFLLQNEFLTHLEDVYFLLQRRFLQFDFIMGQLDQVKSKAATLPEKTFSYQEVQGGLAFFENNRPLAISHYENASKLFKHFLRVDEWLQGNLHTVFYVLALLQQSQLEKVATIIVKLRKFKAFQVLPDGLEALLYIKKGNLEQATEHYAGIDRMIKNYPNAMPLMHALVDWVGYLLNPDALKNKKQTEDYQLKLKSYIALYHLPAAQIYAELLLAVDENNQEANLFLNTRTPFGAFRFLALLPVKQHWEVALEQLQAIFVGAPSTEATPAVQQSRRLAWLINPEHKHVSVVEQKTQKKGGWTAGRAIALKRLYFPMDKSIDYLTLQDLGALTGLKREVYGWYHEENYSFDADATLKALIGHPLIFDVRNPLIPLELVSGQLALHIEHKKEGYYLTLSHHLENPGVILEKETANRYRVINVNEEAVRISKLLSVKGLTIPSSAKDTVISIVTQAKNNIHIHSELEDDTLPTVPGSTTCCMHLLPIGSGLKINLWMRPFETDGSYFRAGHGQATVITADNNNTRKKAIRTFEAEKESAQSLINLCPTLSSLDEQTDEWFIESVEACLEVLHELDCYKQNNPLNIEWPKGQTLKLKQTVDTKNLSLSIKGKDYWFEYDGEVKLDENHTLNMKTLLDLLEQDNGRFIQLADGEFIALTASFKRQLEELKAISTGDKIYHLSSGVLRTLSDEAGELKVNKQWKTHLDKLQSMEKHQPAIPSTLQANLREYQEEGFTYLSKLTHWEIGACLADDMGLGKTVQAIALLLEQAPMGPCIVVAPTSVCFIWLEELAKFAPTLSVHLLHNTNDREALIASLTNMDILICSYGLLHQTGDALCEKNWQLVILDEAQAIKNADTKRWQYATQLKGKGRVALTGTPIENHLGEIWSIFRFLNPGLLGTRDAFQKRYAIPIEKHRDPIAKRTLKALVQPYILRRTKTEVLKELPSKTEQAIIIEPSAEETAFYEAVRIRALERIQQLNKSQDTQKRFGILAEITRLRQACCHASLVDEELTIESSKVKTFLTLVKNLLDNNHKVLVFSQYVKYLSIIKDVLNKETISYQYLDGSTKLDARQKSVNAFQAGEGDVFLISLKAGGTGLNLTAADYVIILDPWWNPAVEDQAADRAHRYGQQRPVTVYRLIMKNSIEEKIIKLHHDKRDLAADLLSGGDMSGKITEEELIRLIAE